MSDPNERNDAMTGADGVDWGGAELRAAEVDAQAGAQPGQAQAGPVGDPVQEARELIDFAAAVVLPFVPERYAVRYGDKELQGIARAWVTLADKRGWNLAEMMGRWGPELAFGAALLGPALPVIVAEVKARREAARPAPEVEAAPA